MSVTINQPKVSVIIPFYNGASWLCEAVQSVLDQTYKNFEIIVVNDGSKENVDSFLDKYKDKIIYKFKPNGGPATARNEAMKYATGDYLAYLDSDDIWLPEKTEQQINFMEKRKIMWSHTGYYNWYPEKDVTTLKKNSSDYGNVYVKSFISLRANTPGIIINKKCFQEHPEFHFFEDMRFAQDSALWSRIAYYYPLGLLDKPLIKIRQRGTNADLQSLIRFSSKAIVYRKIKEGVYPSLPRFVIILYRFYLIGDRVLNGLKLNLGLSKKCLEFFGKCLWVFPFVLERIYLEFLNRKKNNFFYTNE